MQSSKCFSPFLLPDIPSKGNLLAIDSEFVSVAHEESFLADNGSKVTVTEGRNSLARVSVLDCRTNSIFMDDYVLPQEPVVDYLTRFSGIRPEDLDPGSSRHNLVAMRTAYLKLKLLVQRYVVRFILEFFR